MLNSGILLGAIVAAMAKYEPLLEYDPVAAVAKFAGFKVSATSGVIKLSGGKNVKVKVWHDHGTLHMRPLFSVPHKCTEDADAVFLVSYITDAAHACGISVNTHMSEWPDCLGGKNG